MDLPSKRAVLDEAVRRLEREAAALRASAEQTRRAATHEESRAENDKDTRGLEASYLARGQAMRVEETDEAATRLRFVEPRVFSTDDEIGLSAHVVLEDEDGTLRAYLLVPVAGGMQLEHRGQPLWLITPASPVGRAMVGKREGDALTLRRKGDLREHEIVEVS